MLISPWPASAVAAAPAAARVEARGISVKDISVRDASTSSAFLGSVYAGSAVTATAARAAPVLAEAAPPSLDSFLRRGASASRGRDASGLARNGHANGVGAGALALAAAMGASFGAWGVWRFGRREGSVARRAQRKGFKRNVVSAPLPPYFNPSSASGGQVIDVTPPRRINVWPEKARAPDPTVLKLETALSTDSLRILCEVMSDAGGLISPASDSYDRTHKPIMSASLTLRCLLRFVELRHGASDDLTDADWQGKCGTGVQNMLRRCRREIFEVNKEMSSRLDDLIKMMRAFYDLPFRNKYSSFFRAVIEKQMPKLVTQSFEPLPHLLQLVERYGNLQLDFLYEVSLQGLLRESQFDGDFLMRTVGRWVRRGRGSREDGQGLSQIKTSKVKVVALRVALLPCARTPQQRIVWGKYAVWASEPREGLADWFQPKFMFQSDAMERQPRSARERLEARLGKALVRMDPGDLFSLALDCAGEGWIAQAFFELLGDYLTEAFAAAGPKRSAEVLQLVNPVSQATSYPSKLQLAVARAVRAHGEAAPVETVAEVLGVWVKRKLVTVDFVDAFVSSLAVRPLTEGRFGVFAQCGAWLLRMGAADSALKPLFDRLLVDHDEKRALKREKGRTYNLQRSRLGPRLQLLAELYNAADAAEPPQLADASDILELVGARQSPSRPADVAADYLALRLARQVPVCHQEPLEAAINDWRDRFVAPVSVTAEEHPVLAVAIAGDLLAAARGEEAYRADLVEPGDIARCVSALARCRGQGSVEEDGDEEIGLWDLEYALHPFAQANTADMDEAVAMATAGAVRGGAPQAVVELACERWLRGDGQAKLGGLGRCFALSAVKVWLEKGVDREGFDALRAAQAWLWEQVEWPDTARGRSSLTDLQRILIDLRTVFETVDGRPPSLTELTYARDDLMSEVGVDCAAVFSKAVATAWSAAVPGLSPSVAAGYAELWWNGSTDARSLVEDIVGSVLLRLRTLQALRVQATFQGSAAEGFSPAWRLSESSLRKVPWFVPEAVVAEADLVAAEIQKLEQEGQRVPVGVARLREELHFSGKGSVASVDKEMAEKALSSGGCMYCGSSHELKATPVWPVEMTGRILQSNLAPVCRCCKDLSDVLGPKRWGEVVVAEPEEAATVWWTAQRAASVGE